jgi:hypothetical protein
VGYYKKRGTKFAVTNDLMHKIEFFADSSGESSLFCGFKLAFLGIHQRYFEHNLIESGSNDDERKFMLLHKIELMIHKSGKGIHCPKH